MKNVFTSILHNFNNSQQQHDNCVLLFLIKEILSGFSYFIWGGGTLYYTGINDYVNSL